MEEAEKAGPIVYLAAPVFSLAERLWNRRLAQAIGDAVEGSKVFLPQDIRIGGKYNDNRHWPAIFKKCIEALGQSDLVCAMVDGQDADSGTAFEIGYAHKAGIPVLAIRTDFRQSQDKGLNIMLSQAADELMVRMSFDEDPGKLAEEVARRAYRMLESRWKEQPWTKSI